MNRPAGRRHLLGIVWAAVLGAVSGAPAVSAQPLERLAIVHEWARDRNAPPRRPDEFLDTAVYLVRPRQHATLLFGGFATGIEWGGFVRDARGSSYSAALRRRAGGFVSDTSLHLQSEQKFERVIAGPGLLFFWPDHPETSNFLVVPSVSCDVYYLSDCWVFVHVVYDPRPGTGTTFRIGNRWTWGHRYFEFAVAPRTDGVVNSSVSAGWGFATFGYARERDFDFTRLDRRVWSAGVRFDLHP